MYHASAMTLRITRNIIQLSLLVILILFVSHMSPSHHAFATSPSFSYKEIRNEPYSWIDVHKHRLRDDGDHYTELLNVNYFSDGKTLNATLWLAASFNSNISYFRMTAQYSPSYADAHRSGEVC
jgi:hypothetical protein